MSSYYDNDISPILLKADNEGLDPLVKYILDAATETLSINDLYKKYSPDHKNYYSLIVKEICEFGGNSFVNLFRGGGPSYHEVACDVADKVDANYNKDQPVEEIEMAIVMKLMSDSWAKMSDNEKLEFAKETGLGYRIGSIPTSFPFIALQTAIRASGFVAYKIAVIVANAVARAILGRGLTLVANATLTRTLSIFAGPIGWVITGLWTAIDIAGPAYRVTIPCVVHVAMLRWQVSLKTCPKCKSPTTEDMKFCANCGHMLR
jgi:uncharacterized protein YaaW (UPF0174 family)